MANAGRGILHGISTAMIKGRERCTGLNRCTCCCLLSRKSQSSSCVFVPFVFFASESEGHSFANRVSQKLKSRLRLRQSLCIRCERTCGPTFPFPAEGILQVAAAPSPRKGNSAYNPILLAPSTRLYFRTKCITKPFSTPQWTSFQSLHR